MCHTLHCWIMFLWRPVDLCASTMSTASDKTLERGERLSRVEHYACRWKAVEIHYGYVLQTLEADRSRKLHIAFVSIGLWWQAFLNCSCGTLKKNWLWSIPSRTSKEVMSADPLLRSSASQRHRCSHPHRLSQLSETLWKWFWDAFSFRSESTSIVL